MQIILASPRGFCAGVRRAVDIVNNAIIKYGTPLYVKHEIVHNKHVVDGFKKRGVIFTDDISIVPNGSTIVYSAHGVSDAIIEYSQQKNLNIIDATCPLVTKVHREVIKYDEEKREIILIGHRGHPEIEGTSGKIRGNFVIVESPEEAANLIVKDPQNLALSTQTTLSVDDTREIVDILTSRFPILKEFYKNDICYATQNRQSAVKILCNEVDIILVVGAKESSNSNRLRDIAAQNGKPAYLINDASEIIHSWFDGMANIGITAGASAPEDIIEDIIQTLIKTYNATVKDMQNGFEEGIAFHLPKNARI